MAKTPRVCFNQKGIVFMSLNFMQCHHTNIKRIESVVEAVTEWPESVDRWPSPKSETLWQAERKRPWKQPLFTWYWNQTFGSWTQR